MINQLGIPLFRGHPGRLRGGGAGGRRGGARGLGRAGPGPGAEPHARRRARPGFVAASLGWRAAAAEAWREAVLAAAAGMRSGLGAWAGPSREWASGRARPCFAVTWSAKQDARARMEAAGLRPPACCAEMAGAVDAACALKAVESEAVPNDAVIADSYRRWGARPQLDISIWKCVRKLWIGHTMKLRDNYAN
jgi:hypothetical protein